MRGKTHLKPLMKYMNKYFKKHTGKHMYIMWIFFFLQLMNTEFDIISQARNPCKINLAKYNHNTMEFITFGPGYFVVWLKF